MSNMFGWTLLLAVAVLLFLRLPKPVEGQAQPYLGYQIEGGCLYITPQGFAVIREWSPLNPHPCK